MCLEHKQYWQCCLKVDSTYIDPCPLADVGELCTIRERVHPIGGYCHACRRSRNKVEDDICTTPLYTKNDDYSRPWAPSNRPVISRHMSEQIPHPFHESRPNGYERHRRESQSHSTSKPTRYKPIKSQPLVFPDKSYGPAPERGRNLKRPASPPPALPVITPLSPLLTDYNPLPLPKQSSKHSYHSHRLPSPPSSSSDDDDYKYKKHHRHHDKHTSKSKRKDHRRHDSSSSSEPVQYRVASPRTIRRLQRQGVLPPMDELRAMTLASRIDHR